MRRPAPARAAVTASLLAMLASGMARAQGDQAVQASGGGDRPAVQKFYPPPVDGPALRLPESPTRLYLDAAYAVSNDLSSLPYIAGSAKNFRFAAGGTWRWHRFSVDGEVNFANVTSLHVTDALNEGPPFPEDQTGTALGDIRVGATWTERLADEALIAGVGLRTRLPTHTTHFDFYLPTNGDMVSYVFPYYFHIEPTVILGGAIGRFTYVVNEGGLIFMGPNGNFLGMEVIVPTIMFWDSHVAVGYAPWDFLGASVELGTDVQVNHVSDPQFPINNIRSLWLAPALQGHIGDWRVDAIARFGFGRGSETFGVLEYVGTNSFTLRATLAFIVSLAAAVGCSSNSGQRPDASRDGVTYDLSLDLPPGCPPAQANEKGIGAPCTRNGHECTNGLTCACDTTLGITLNGVPCICTIAEPNPQNGAIPCSAQPANLCGSNATCCNYMKIAYYCSPNACLPGGQCIDFGGIDAGH